MIIEPTVQVATKPTPESVGHPVLRFYFEYWLQKRRGRAMPSRADIKPMEIKPHLGSAMILEALPGLNDFRYRLVGTSVARYLLGDATGRTIRETYEGTGVRREF